MAQPTYSARLQPVPGTHWSVKDTLRAVEIWSQIVRRIRCHLRRNMDYLDALDHIRIIRKNLHKILLLVPNETWNNYIFHPESGKLTLVDWIALSNDHIDVHVEQIRRNLFAWRELHEKVLA